MTLPDPKFWRGRRVLVTGHTGFEGGWLALWLAQMGAKVTGFALAPEYQGGIFGATNLAARITSVTADIRNSSLLRHCIEIMRPEIVFHLAAQSSTHHARFDPAETYETNLLGTARTLEELRRFSFVRAVVVGTSDKVYENRHAERPFREDDPLGGLEPYGVSKAGAELVVQAFRRSLGEDSALAVATARAGNIIGGGDWTPDKLVPDAMTAFTAGEPLMVRAPAAIQPWQHVLDPLCGYLLLAARLADREDADPALWRSAWNFGPDEGGVASVREVADRLVTFWNSHDLPAHTPMASWRAAETEGESYETRVPGVDSSKARLTLEWKPRLPLDKALAATADWYKAQQRGENMAMHSAMALDDYLSA